MFVEVVCVYYRTYLVFKVLLNLVKDQKWDDNGIVSFPLECCVCLGKEYPAQLSHCIEKKVMLKEAMTCSETFDLLVTHLELRSRPLFSMHFPQCGSGKGGHHTAFCTQVKGKK